MQQLTVGEHAWPRDGQLVEGWHVPLVPPGGMEHDRPVQQSPLTVQTALCGWQAAGAWQVVPLQMPEQHCAAELQPELFARQVPASG